jgi:hypothetical protein
VDHLIVKINIKEKTMSSQYEFSGEQNTLIGSLGKKMGFVGLFAVILGVINLIITLLVVVAIYRDRLPATWKTKTTEYLQKSNVKLPDEISMDKMPANNHLWGLAINAGIVSLFYIFLGTWTRSAGQSFQKIVSTQGNDISNLMNGLGSLHSMYSLLYTLLVITLFFGLVSVVFTLFHYFTAS